MSRPRVLLLLTFLGLGATTWSTWVHYQLLQSPEITSACDISATVSCSEAYRSEYGTLAGVPVALLGVCWFAGVLLLQLGSRVAGVPAREHVTMYLFAVGLPALAFSAYLAYASWFVLKVICLLCLTTYIAVAGIVLIAGMSTRLSMSSFSERLLRDVRAAKARPIAMAVALLFVVSAVGLLGFFPKEPGLSAAFPAPARATGELPAPGSPDGAGAPMTASEQDNVQAQLQQYLDTQPRRMIPVDAVGAAVVVVKFNDYQCPPCKQTFELYKPIKQKWEQQAPGRVKFVTKDFPLEGECNANAPRGVHVLACEAASAVRMARRNNKAEPLEDWLFANQGSLTLDGLKKAVRDIGGVADFDAQYPRVLNDVKVDTSLGGFLGVQSTPTFFINGVQVPNLQPQLLDAAIAYELKKAAK
jgi:uncharacterized membrane protein/protein-disulfide isomerase